jgi:DNA-binding transcriptional LysR family regulator
MIDLRGTDLNLLVSLDALIDETNVTRAAARLNVSQPALSAQLARLRHLFGDPLLVPSRSGRGMIPTARALELRVPLQLALKELENIIKRPPAFDPLTANRTFAIAATDNGTAVLGVDFVERIRGVAGPDVRVSFRTPSLELMADQLERGEVDLLMGSARMVPKDMKTQTLFDDRYLMAQRKGHPRGRKPLSMQAYCGLSHVLVSTSGGSFHGDIDEQLEKIGRRRRVVLSVHQFSIVPMFLKVTDYVATLPARFVTRLADEFDLFDLPFKARGYSLLAAWHPRNQVDPGHVWLRGELRRIAAGRQ